MNGSEFHENMISRFEIAFWEQRLRTERQFAIKNEGRPIGFGDLLVWGDELEQVLLVEIEMRKTRAMNDVIKRRALGLGDNAILWIVTPTGKLAREIQRQLRCPEIDATEPIYVLPFGTALEAVLGLNGTKIPSIVK